MLHTVPFALYCFVTSPNVPQYALAIAIGAGGDTDSVGAILGGWLGALHGESALPASLIARIHDGPYGPTHLRALGQALSAVQYGETVSPPSYSRVAALARNLALYPVVLAHGFRRLVPF